MCVCDLSDHAFAVSVCVCVCDLSDYACAVSVCVTVCVCVCDLSNYACAVSVCVYVYCVCDFAGPQPSERLLLSARASAGWPHI